MLDNVPGLYWECCFRYLRLQQITINAYVVKNESAGIQLEPVCGFQRHKDR
jgi:hypothetical protein